MLQNMNDMLKLAELGHYAVPQFNTNNLEWTRFILEACSEKQSPVILGVSEGAVKYMGGYNTVFMMVKGLLKDLKINIPVALHLDHATSFEACRQAIEAGFTSVMIDASKYDLDKNIEITKQVVALAHRYNVTVEAEVGHVGGYEDGIASGILLADVNEASLFVTATDIDFLAPALGTVHGLYNGKADINFERTKEIAAKVKRPLVLHGGTGVANDMLKEAIACGICKINFNTELQVAWTRAVRGFLTNDHEVYDPRKIIKSGEIALKEAIYNKISLLGSRIGN